MTSQIEHLPDLVGLLKLDSGVVGAVSMSPTWE